MNIERLMQEPSSHSYQLKHIFQKKVEKILVHRVFAHPLFSYLYDLSAQGMTTEQFHIYRDNYLFRTFNTIPSLSYVLIKAAYHCDFHTLASVGRNLYEETGEGDAKQAHSFLLDRSHNIHGQVVFSLNPISLKDINQSSLILEEAHYFVNEQKKLYEGSVYGVALGAMFGQEMAAESMLRVFYETLFLPYKGYYPPDKFKDAQIYFSSHLNGVEERHGQDARKAAFNFCKNEESVELVLNAAEAFLDLQANLWDGLLKALLASTNEGTFVPVSRAVSNFTILN